ncbi:protein IQ-DOMAIN 1 isoform X1 [Sorghum bicolor]|uniref:protein IQ-DOMAIN 1 isoform X1 n=1 Tax=Sorghum bicolor TaxID=4558 RepID=UPI0003C6832E|nr:protein IQ-DOMAIN 1 isoform X1 [Sorghum bicolor]XP_021303288.1 protein IQ-DOMAIN 1 isoform X1 [Sorghum bicolor]|eukprot:XP_021303282.1 protein IQ-DOMAIN 1 isoform X1 [Sorghum bicolor]
MGISSKWIKSLVGIRKQEKGQNAEKQEKGRNAESSETMSSANESLHKQKHSLVPGGALAVEEIAVQSGALTDDKSTQMISNSICSDNTSLDVQISQAEHHSKEDLAATVVQSAFRAFLARRALRALKGIVLLQALIRGHSVRRQTTETLQCMQALVKAQARVRARQVRVALENQVARKKIPEQDDHENHVREVEGGWCGSIGSMEEMQAKALKRREAAAKRERAMAYALTHQRQAGSKQQISTSLQGLELGENHWGSNWLDRWMAVRPWENRLLDCNAKESLPTHEDKKDEEANSQITPKGKVSTSNTPGLSKKKGVNHKKSYSDVSCTSFARQANVLPSTSLGSSKQKAKVTDEVFEEVSSQPTDIGSKAVRNPKDKLVQVNAPAKKRLSLPNNVGREAGKGPTHRNSINRSGPKAQADAPNQGGEPVELQA